MGLQIHMVTDELHIMNILLGGVIMMMMTLYLTRCVAYVVVDLQMDVALKFQ